MVDDEGIIHVPAGGINEVPGMIQVDSYGDGGTSCVNGVAPLAGNNIQIVCWRFSGWSWFRCQLDALSFLIKVPFRSCGQTW